MHENLGPRATNLMADCVEWAHMSWIIQPDSRTDNNSPLYMPTRWPSPQPTALIWPNITIRPGGLTAIKVQLRPLGLGPESSRLRLVASSGSPGGRSIDPSGLCSPPWSITLFGPRAPGRDPRPLQIDVKNPGGFFTSCFNELGAGAGPEARWSGRSAGCLGPGLAKN